MSLIEQAMDRMDGKRPRRSGKKDAVSPAEADGTDHIESQATPASDLSNGHVIDVPAQTVNAPAHAAAPGSSSEASAHRGAAGPSVWTGPREFPATMKPTRANRPVAESRSDQPGSTSGPAAEQSQSGGFMAGAGAAAAAAAAGVHLNAGADGAGDSPSRPTNRAGLNGRAGAQSMGSPQAQAYSNGHAGEAKIIDEIGIPPANDGHRYVNGAGQGSDHSGAIHRADDFVMPEQRSAAPASEDRISVEDASGAIVLSRSATVEMNLSKIGADSYLNPRAKRTPVLDAFRRIKRPLLANAFGQGLPAVDRGQRILVTSSVPAEGKTFTSLHLALSIAAELDTSVILVDADIVKPTVLEMIDVDPRPGIADWFQYPRPTAPELVLRTNIEGLRLLPAGAWKPNSVEVLASRSIGGFFDELTAAFPNDIIVVDSPPVLAASETSSLASHMGQIVFVVGSGTTSQSEVQAALDLLRGEQVISLMLNRSRHNSVLGHYGY